MNLSSEKALEGRKKYSVGDRLQELLNELNLTQKKFGELTSIQPTTISGIIKHGKRPNSDTLQKMHTYGVNVAWLVSGQGTKLVDKNSVSGALDVQGETSQTKSKEEGQLLLQLRTVAEKLVRLRREQSSMNPKIVEFEKAEVIEVLTRTIYLLDPVAWAMLRGLLDGLIQSQDEQRKITDTLKTDETMIKN